jgi:hypothetical protein
MYACCAASVRLTTCFLFVPHRWVGVLSSYILRPSELSLQRHAAYRHSNSWTSPVVGVHVRRTDKITSGEAKLHSVPEYMSHVERYCDWKLGPGWQRQQQQRARQPTDAQTSAPDTALTQLHGPKCTVYLATDQPSILEEIQTHFPHIHVITNPVALATGVLRSGTSLGLSVLSPSCCMAWPVLQTVPLQCACIPQCMMPLVSQASRIQNCRTFLSICPAETSALNLVSKSANATFFGSEVCMCRQSPCPKKSWCCCCCAATCCVLR